MLSFSLFNPCQGKRLKDEKYIRKGGNNSHAGFAAKFYRSEPYGVYCNGAQGFGNFDWFSIFSHFVSHFVVIYVYLIELIIYIYIVVYRSISY